MQIAERDRRALRIASLVIGGMLAARAVPAIHARAVDAHVAAHARLIARRAELAMVADSVAIRARAAQDERVASSFDEVLLAASSPAGAMAAAAATLTATAGTAKAELGPMQLRVDSTSARPLRIVTITAPLTGTVESIADLLARLESRPTMFAVRELALARSSTSPGPQSENLHGNLVAEVVYLPPVAGGDRR